MNDEELREKVKIYKGKHNIYFNQIANELGIKPRSMYNWLAGQFDLSSRNKRKLIRYLTENKGE